MVPAAFCHTDCLIKVPCPPVLNLRLSGQSVPSSCSFLAGRLIVGFFFSIFVFYFCRVVDLVSGLSAVNLNRESPASRGVSFICGIDAQDARTCVDQRSGCASHAPNRPSIDELNYSIHSFRATRGVTRSFLRLFFFVHLHRNQAGPWELCESLVGAATTSNSDHNNQAVYIHTLVISLTLLLHSPPPRKSCRL